MASGTRLALLLLALAPTMAGAAPRRVAVLEFQARWAATCDAPSSSSKSQKNDAERCEFLGSLADQARAGALEVLRPPGYIVMTRENTAQLLKDMGSSTTCTEGECEVETAKLIGAELVISGGVTQLEGIWIVTVKLHDVKTAALLDTTEAEGKEKVKTRQAVKRAVAQMVKAAMAVISVSPVPAAVSSPVTRSAPVAEGVIGSAAPVSFGSEPDDVLVSFESDPEGAAVLVDGQMVCASAPCRKRMAAGSHEAVFQKERHSAARQPFTAATGAVVKGTLAPQFGWVSVETTPSGLGVAIGGTEVGKSPVAWREQEPGGVEVVVSDPCYQRTGERVALKVGERRAVKVTAQPRMAGLKVDAEDEKGNALEGKVRVDGVEIGAVGKTLTVPVCSRRVEVPLGRETFAADLKLEEGKVARVTAKPGAAVAAGGMARLPGGTYTMGETKKTVTVQPFLLDVTEVTVGAYAACVKAGECKAVNGGAKSDHPVVNVDWNEAVAYCAWAGKRLPTEEEWEWAARGAEKGTTYPWGNEAPGSQLCWGGSGNDRKARGFDATCPVGSYPRGDSPQGVKDLAGNVWEWTSTAYDASSRVGRGGCWRDDVPDFVSAADRGGRAPGYRGNSLGFRCARTP